MDSQGHYRSSVEEEIMETAALELKNTLVLLKEKGLIITWNNNEIVSWYSSEGRKLETKSKYKKTPLAIVYLMRRNDLATLTKSERKIESIREIERERSDELQKLRAQTEAFTYEKQSWTRQSELMAREINGLKKKLKTGGEYISALEDCCGNAGFPVAAVKQAALEETFGSEKIDDSDDDDVAASTNKTRRAIQTEERAPIQKRQQSQRSPIKTRTKSSEAPSKSVRVAVLKTMKNANDEVTTISRPLTCDECSKHKQVVGVMPRKGPFQPYWETLMLQATVYKLETRDVWQIALLTIPEELRSKLTPELKSGRIIEQYVDEDDEAIYERLKQALLDLRGPTNADWSRILEIKQANGESFEAYAERVWVTYKEHSGMENASRDHEPLLEIIKKNAGTPVQRALINGVDPVENSFRAVVDWGSRIEQRWRLKPRAVASAHWLTEGNGADKFDTRNRMVCHYCKKPNHGIKHCRKREKDIRNQLAQDQSTMSTIDSNLEKQFKEFIAKSLKDENSRANTTPDDNH
nr:uncharacterized protein LOC129441969 [Misgurnus anguillicaudatus]